VAGAQGRRYVFGPLAEGAALMGLRASQVAVLGAGLVGAVVLLYVGGSGLGAFLALVSAGGAVAIAFVPIAGRSAEQWLPLIARWSGRRLRGNTAYRAAGPTAGACEPLGAGEPVETAPSLPDTLVDLDLLSIPVRGGELGAIRDRRRDTYVGILAAKVGSFGLLDTAVQERRLEQWGSVLASFAAEQSPVRRIQWLERTVPSDGDELTAEFQAERDRTVPLSSSPVRSYIELIESAGDVTREHEILVALQIDARRGWRAVRRAGGGAAGACDVLAAELRSLADRLALADVAVDGALRPGQVAAAIRHAFDPYGRHRRGRLAKVDGGEGHEPATIGPTGAETSWDRYRTDSAIHASYWIAAWPRLAVGPAFLTPLLARGDLLRTVSVTLEPVAPFTATRRAEQEATKEQAEVEAKGRKGFRLTARGRQRLGAAEQREEELAAGHAEVRFAGFVTVSAPSGEELERSRAEVEHAAQRARLDLEPLYGSQDLGFSFTLPLCRGLR
jgi:hypothetical protein